MEEQREGLSKFEVQRKEPSPKFTWLRCTQAFIRGLDTLSSLMDLISRIDFYRVIVEETDEPTIITRSRVELNYSQQGGIHIALPACI